ncbi:hypothetical protein [Streptomyces cadmiisoli]|uniref:hypothetical protein n=1 Tax=Streptomyces cadmiisoli TaxID=2184053 RepID=UPI00365A627D
MATFTHLATLAAVLESGDRARIARTFGEIAEELLALAAVAPSGETGRLLLSLHEDVRHAAGRIGGA